MTPPVDPAMSIAMSNCAGGRSRAPGCSRLGLALLQHRGVTAWTRAWQSTAPGPPVSPTAAASVGVPVGEREIVRALASMALACTAAAA